MIFPVFIVFLSSFLLTWLSIPVIVRISYAKSLFDQPGQRKINKVAVPNLGGVAIFIGIVISTLLGSTSSVSPDYQYLLTAIVVMFFIGLKDDILIIAPVKKLGIQFLVAVMLVVMGGFHLTQLYGLGFISSLDNWLSFPVSLLFILFLVNSINLIDGIDGLAGGITMFVFTVLGVWFSLSGYLNYSIICFASVGSLLAFLRFNLWGHDNKIFMGDTGSLILGVIVSAMAIQFNEFNGTVTSGYHFPQAPVILFALLIVPVSDTLRVFIVRICQKRSPFSPDMNHIHHMLVKCGLSHIQASSGLVLYTVVFFLLAFILQQYISITLNFAILLSLDFMSIGLLCKRKKRVQVTDALKAQLAVKEEVTNIQIPYKSGQNLPLILNRVREPVD